MARSIHKLSASAVKAASKPGALSDGGGLWLRVSGSQTKSWVFRYMMNGRAREMGLGAISLVSLAEAREAAMNCRKQIVQGIDPVDQRKADRQARIAEAKKKVSFSTCARRYIEIYEPSWKSPKHAGQWRSTLETYVNPRIGEVLVDEVDTKMILAVLEPIWSTIPETASRLRGRIESILDWAKVQEFRTGENPARWRGHLEYQLPKRSHVQAVRHHPALHYNKVGEFLVELRARSGVAARALEFTILCAARTNETRFATWAEVNLESATWTIPAERMKAGKLHQVPLSNRAAEILQEMLLVRESEFVFPGQSADGSISNMAMLKVLERMGRGDLTVHGFRSTFRDWAADQTRYSGEVAEMALAHAIQSRSEAAYRRGDLFMKRRQLMQDWADWCSAPRIAQEIVVPLIQRAA